MVSSLFVLLLIVIVSKSESFDNDYDHPRTTIPERATLTDICNEEGNNALPMEMAKVHFHTNLNSSNIYIYGRSDECYNCLYLPLSIKPVIVNNKICVIIDTQHSYSIGYSYQQPFSGCNTRFNVTGKTCPWQPSKYIIKPSSYHYHQYEHYSIQIKQSQAIRVRVKSAPNKYIPIYIAIVCLLFIILGYNIYRLYFKNKFIYNDHNVIDDDKNDKIRQEQENKKKKRVISLDAFRGMSLIIMIFVNYGGGGYWWLNHSNWNGLTVADLVFPWFIFIMGTAMAIVFPRKLKKIVQQQHDNQMQLALNNDLQPKITRFSILSKVMTRGFKLFFIGLFIINEAFDLQYMRIPGVLQYFAISYIINSLIIIFTEPLDDDDLNERSIPQISNLFIPEIILYWKQWLIAILILTINLILVFTVSFTIYDEKCEKGYFGPGGIGDYGKHIECTGGVHRYIDYKLFGHNHVYQYSTAHKIYATGWYDPEGFLGSLTATILTFFGILVGRVLTIYKYHKQRLIKWFIYCIIFGLIAGSFCGFKQNGGTIPVNKNLWSLSFICCQASTGIFVLSIFYLLIDVLNVWSGAPFHWLGSNSIIIYTGSEIFAGYFPFGFSYGDKDHYKLLLSNCIGVSLWIIIAGYLFNKKIFYAL